MYHSIIVVHVCSLVFVFTRNTYLDLYQFHQEFNMIILEVQLVIRCYLYVKYEIKFPTHYLL